MQEASLLVVVGKANVFSYFIFFISYSLFPTSSLPVTYFAHNRPFVLHRPLLWQ